MFHKLFAMLFEILWNCVWNTSMRLADFVWAKRRNLQACTYIYVNICAYYNIYQCIISTLMKHHNHIKWRRLKSLNIISHKTYISVNLIWGHNFQVDKYYTLYNYQKNKIRKTLTFFFEYDVKLKNMYFVNCCKCLRIYRIQNNILWKYFSQ